MSLIFSLAFIIGASLLATFFAQKLRQPAVVALIILGVTIGTPFLREIFLGPNVDFIKKIGEAGLICLMFLAGLEISWSMLYQEKKEAALVASFAAALPFILGFLAFTLLGFPFSTALLVGVCISVTAEATKARVLLGIKKLKTKVGSLMIGAGIIDDILGISSLFFISYFFAGSFKFDELFLLLAAIVAFFAGILVHKAVGRKMAKVKYLEKFLLFFVVPFFFVAMGIDFSFPSLAVSPFILLLIVLIAILGKIGGTLLTKPFLHLSFKKLYLIGWGMNSRGAVGLAIAFIGFKIGLLPTDIYSAIIVTALLTTLIFPFVLTGMIKKDPLIME